MRNLISRIFRRTAIHNEVREEIESHIEMRAELNRKSGMSDEQALRDARRRCGNSMLVVEDARAAWGWPRLENWLRDIQHGFCIMIRQPGVSAVVVLTLALWKRRFNEDTSVLGRTLKLENLSYAIAAVMSRSSNTLQPQLRSRPQSRPGLNCSRSARRASTTSSAV